MRGKKCKRIRREYAAWLKEILPYVPEGRRPISERVFRRRVARVRG
jgi:hypothetical protein